MAVVSLRFPPPPPGLLLRPRRQGDAGDGGGVEGEVGGVEMKQVVVNAGGDIGVREARVGQGGGEEGEGVGGGGEEKSEGGKVEVVDDGGDGVMLLAEKEVQGEEGGVEDGQGGDELVDARHDANRLWSTGLLLALLTVYALYR
jgi:hypothetical protein